MISEIIQNRKQRIILLCLLFSLLIHLGFIALNFVHQFNNAEPLTFPTAQKPKPMMMMQKPPQSMHRMHRAGTGKNAPKTEKALGMGQSVPIQAPQMQQRTPPPQQQKPQRNLNKQKKSLHLKNQKQRKKK